MRALWNLEEAAERNRVALLRVIASLCAMIGMVPVGPLATVPRHLRNRVRVLLLPTESAVRRLIVIAARGVSVTLQPLRPKRAQNQKRTATEAAASFPLLDTQWYTGPPRRRYAKGPGPRIIIFDGRPIPLNTYREPEPDDPLDAAPLCQRLRTLEAVLADLPKQARRLALWRARRIERYDHVPPGPLKRTNPLRGGRPPGTNARRRHAIVDILKECDGWARSEVRAPDTS